MIGFIIGVIVGVVLAPYIKRIKTEADVTKNISADTILPTPPKPPKDTEIK